MGNNKLETREEDIKFYGYKRIIINGSEASSDLPNRKFKSQLLVRFFGISGFSCTNVCLLSQLVRFAVLLNIRSSFDCF